MSFFKLVLSASLLVSLFLPGTSVANDFYNNGDDVIRHYYQPGNNAASPWNKKTADEQGIADYYVCYDKVVNQNAGLYLVVMCPDMEQISYDNQPAPTDYYVLQQTSQGLKLLFDRQNFGGHFDGVANIGPDKWAVHSIISSMNQGYGQSHDLLEVFSEGKFIPVANWTSWMSNEGAFANGETEEIKNQLTVDESQSTAGFYALTIHSSGYRQKTKINKKYLISYSEDSGNYLIPEELTDGY